MQRLTKELGNGPRSLSWPGLNFHLSRPAMGHSILSLSLLNLLNVHLHRCTNFCCMAKWFSYTQTCFHILFRDGLSLDAECSSLRWTLGSCCSPIPYVLLWEDHIVWMAALSSPSPDSATSCRCHPFPTFLRLLSHPQVVSASLRPHGPQHARPPCPAPSDKQVRPHQPPRWKEALRRMRPGKTPLQEQI